MRRLILSILAGMLATVLLTTATDYIFHSTGIFPPVGEPMLDKAPAGIAFAYRAIFAIFGAYLTAVVAREQAKKAVLIVGVIGSVMWLIGAIIMWKYSPAWYNIGGVITGVPFAWLGGKLYEQYKLRRLAKHKPVQKEVL
jgi:hypothetical protein